MKSLYRHVMLSAALASVLPAVAIAKPGCEAPGSGQSIRLETCQEGDSLILHGLNFETGTATLGADSKELLQQVAGALIANPGIKVNIQGHTDNIGQAGYNLELSQFRAEAVREYLVRQGVSAARLQAMGFGETDPLADNATMAGRAQNRRVELFLMGAGRAVAAVSKPATPPAPKTVYMTTFSAQPDKLTVPVGTTVTWKNYDEITHSVMLPDETSQRLWTSGWKGQSFSKTFDKPGQYDFRCGVHNDVHGTITVTAAPVVEVTAPAPAYTGNTLSGIPTMPAPLSDEHQGGAMSPVAPAPMAPMAEQASTPAATGDMIVIARHAFSPSLLSVPVGTAVTWRNDDDSSHRIAFADLTSDVMGKGDSYSRSFDSPGEYPYQCGIHSYMKGKVVVGQS